MRTHLKRSDKATSHVFEPLELRRLLAAVGPDGFGYFADPHTFENINLVPGGASVFTIITNTDDDGGVVSLGSNTFNFYGTSYTGEQLTVSANGRIELGGGIISPLSDDWIGTEDGAGQVLGKFQDTGGSSAPDRLIIEWNKTSHYSSSPSSVTFQAILQLNTGSAPGQITFNYVDLDTGDSSNDGATATVEISQGGYQLMVKPPSTTSALVGGSKAILINSTGGVEEVDGVVTVTGTELNDEITLSVSGANLQVLRNGSTTPFLLADVTRVEIRTRDGADTINCAGISLPLSIDGGEGDDVIAGGSGNDNIFANDGLDNVTAGAGNDTIRGWNGEDVIDAGAGNDFVLGGDADDTLIGGDGDDTLSGGAQRDRIFGGLGNDRLNGNGGHDRLYGEPGADRLYGYDGNDWLDGGSSNDRLEGGAGIDTLYGQGGNDRFFTADGGEVDQLFGGADDDTGVVDASDILLSVRAV